MLTIKTPKSLIEDKQILKGINLEVKLRRHAIMPLNGSFGKSTLLPHRAREEYEITDGSIQYEGEDLHHGSRRAGA